MAWLKELHILIVKENIGVLRCCSSWDGGWIFLHSYNLIINQTRSRNLQFPIPASTYASFGLSILNILSDFLAQLRAVSAEKDTNPQFTQFFCRFGYDALYGDQFADLTIF